MMTGTVLNLAPVGPTRLVVVTVLSVLLTLAQPEVSSGLAFLPRLGFWLLHVGLGIFAILLASVILQRLWTRPIPFFIYLTLSGVGGTLLATPFFVLLDPLHASGQTDDWLDLLAQQGGWQSFLAEFLEVVPKLLPCWYTINLPLLFGQQRQFGQKQQADLRQQWTQPVTLPATVSPAPLIFDVPASINIDQEIEQQEIEQQEKEQDQFFARLPQIIGRDLIAISSDLHYLNVQTTLGKAMILGSLKECIEVLGEAGLQVHRSNWVAKSHVTRVHLTGNIAYCLMSNGMKVPISRSKRKAVKEIFGQGNIVHKAARETPTQPH